AHDEFRHGSGTAAKILAGSKAKKIKESSLDELPLYGKLKHFSIGQLKEIIKSLIKHNYLEKQKTGKFSYRLAITDMAKKVLTENNSIPDISIPAPSRVTRNQRKKEKEKFSDNVDYDEISYKMLQENKTPQEIADERGLRLTAIFNHLKKYVESGDLSIYEIIDD
ncbi:MAG: RQC domain-containing protein, partial [Flavobacteriales bacterium]